MIKTMWDGVKYSDLNGKIPVYDLCEFILEDAKSILKTRFGGDLFNTPAEDIAEEIFWDIPEYDGIKISEEASKIVLIVSADLSSTDINRWLTDLEIKIEENNNTDLFWRIYKKDNKEQNTDIDVEVYYIYDQIYKHLPIYVADSIKWIKENGYRTMYYKYIEYLVDFITTEYRITINEDNSNPYELLYSNSREIGVALAEKPVSDFDLYVFRWKQIEVLEIN